MKKAPPYVTISDDYAMLRLADGTTFYYGYEEVLEDEWCFKVQEDGYTAIITFSQLGMREGSQFSDMAGCLLKGMGIYLQGKKAFGK